MYEKTLSKETVYRGRIIDVERQKIETGGGLIAEREIVRHVWAVAVLAFLPDGRMLLVKQYRKAIEQELLEVVAGCREKGETPEACARRELQEETGYRADTMSHLGSIFPSPGFTDEIIEVFQAKVAAEGGEKSPDDDEHLDLFVITPAEFEAMIVRGEVKDSKSLAAWTLYQLRGVK